jgi:hypothetical protein
MISLVGIFVFFCGALMIDSNRLQQYAMHVCQLSGDIHLAVYNTERGLDFDLWTLNNFNKVLMAFSEDSGLYTWFYLDPYNEIVEKTQSLQKSSLVFYDLILEPTKNDVIISYTRVRPAFNASLRSLEEALDRSIQKGQQLALILLSLILISVIGLYFLIMYPLIREISNFNMKRSSSLIFKEFKEKLPSWNKK